METHQPINTSDMRMLQSVAPRTTNGERSSSYMTPVSPCTNWVTVNTNANVASSVGNLATPGNSDSTDSPHVRKFDAGQSGTSVLVRMRYTAGGVTPATIRVFGFDGSYLDNNNRPVQSDLSQNVRPKPEALADDAGNYAIVLTPDSAVDPQDADGFAYTKSVRIDMHGNLELLFLVSVAGAANSSIEARVI